MVKHLQKCRTQNQHDSERGKTKQNEVTAHAPVVLNILSATFFHAVVLFHLPDDHD